jgi:hypothetical protein
MRRGEGFLGGEGGQGREAISGAKEGGVGRF